MNEVKQKGLVTELQCELDFAKLGFPCLKSNSEDIKYDLLVDINGKLIKVQCKTCRVKEDESAIHVTLSCSRINTKQCYKTFYSENEIDYFYTFYKNKSYLIPVSLKNKDAIILRLMPPANNQNNYNRAEDFELEKILQKDFPEIEFQKFKHNIYKK